MMVAAEAQPIGTNTGGTFLDVTPPIVAGNCAQFTAKNAIGDAGKTCGGVVVACGTAQTAWQTPCNVNQALLYVR